MWQLDYQRKCLETFNSSLLRQHTVNQYFFVFYRGNKATLPFNRNLS